MAQIVMTMIIDSRDFIDAISYPWFLLQIVASTVMFVLMKRETSRIVRMIWFD
jgi:hypothetical protein